MEKLKKIPKMRFPEFEGEWERKKLGVVSTKIGDGLHGTPMYQENTGIHFINGNNLIDGKIFITENTKEVPSEVRLKNEKGLTKNTLLISINGTIGNIARYNDENIMLGKSVGYFIFENDCSFYFHLLNTNNVQNHFVSELTGTTIKNLSLKTLRETEISYPTLPEQTRIASFLTSIDQKISQLKQKKALLEQYKKGIMQKLFSQELRFKDENGEEYPKWEKKKLCDIGVFKNGINKSNEDFGFGYPFINLMDVFGKPTISNLKLDLVNANEKELQLYDLKKGDVLFIRSSVKKEGVGETSLILEDLPNTVFIWFLIRFRDEKHRLNLNFKKYCFAHKKFRESLISLSTTSANTNINQVSLNDLEISLPTIPEQNKIANFLSSIDKKISHTQTQIQQTEQYKKGLLQKMFC